LQTRHKYISARHTPGSASADRPGGGTGSDWPVMRRPSASSSIRCRVCFDRYSFAVLRAVNHNVGNLPPMPGVFPDYPAPVVRNAGADRELVTMRWGMPPPPKFGGSTYVCDSCFREADNERPGMGARPRQRPTGGKQLMPDDDRDLCEVCWSPLQTLMKKLHEAARAKRNSSDKT
jgi:hypothetical protein